MIQAVLWNPLSGQLGPAAQNLVTVEELFELDKFAQAAAPRASFKP